MISNSKWKRALLALSAGAAAPLTTVSRGRLEAGMGTHVVPRGRRRVARATLALAFLAVFFALAAVFVLPAGASPRGVNGQLAFGLFNPVLGDQQVYVVNPDGVGGARLVQGPNDIGESPMWFPDGIHVATGGAPDLPGGGSRIINTDDGTWRDVGG